MPTTRSASRSRDTVSPAFSTQSDTIVVNPHPTPSTPLRSTRSSSRRPTTPGPTPGPSGGEDLQAVHPRQQSVLNAGNPTTMTSTEVLTPIRRSLRSSSVTPIGSPLPPSSSSSTRKQAGGVVPPSSSRRAGSKALSVEPDSGKNLTSLGVEVEVEIQMPTSTPSSTNKKNGQKNKTNSNPISISTPTPLDLSPSNPSRGRHPTPSRRTPRSTLTPTPTPSTQANLTSSKGPDSARSTGTATNMEKTDSMITDDLLGGHSPIRSDVSNQDQTPTRPSTSTSTSSTPTSKPRRSTHRRSSIDLLVEDSEKILGETVADLKEDWEEQEERDVAVGRHTRSHDLVHGHGHGVHVHVDEPEVEREGEEDEEVDEVEVDEEATPRALDVVLEEDELDDEDEDEDEDDSVSVGSGDVVGMEANDSEDQDQADPESDSESESQSDSEGSGGESDSSEEDPELFLSRALESAQKSKPNPSHAEVGQEGGLKVGLEKGMEEKDDDDVWILDPEAKEREAKRRRERPIPGLTIPQTTGIPLHNLSLGPQDRLGKKRAEREQRKRVQAEIEAREKAEAAAEGHKGEGKGKGKERESLEDVVKRGVEVDDAKFEKPLSRKDKLKLPPRKTTSQAWSSLPTIPSALLPQMRRDYQAMHLRDSLDPKRFMKGKVKSTVPENFAIGTLIAPPRHLQSTTLARERKYNPGDIVQSIVTDSDLGGYAKRKFDDFAGKRMEHGKGKGWKKRKGEGW